MNDYTNEINLKLKKIISKTFSYGLQKIKTLNYISISNFIYVKTSVVLSVFYKYFIRCECLSKCYFF